MPCSDGPKYGDPDFFSWEENPNTMRPLLCQAIKLLRTRGVTLTGDLAKWAKIHDAKDAEREAREARAAARKKHVSNALKKLTFEEREALGVYLNELDGED